MDVNGAPDEKKRNNDRGVENRGGVSLPRTWPEVGGLIHVRPRSSNPTLVGEHARRQGQAAAVMMLQNKVLTVSEGGEKDPLGAIAGFCLPFSEGWMSRLAHMSGEVECCTAFGVGVRAVVRVRARLVGAFILPTLLWTRFGSVSTVLHLKHKLIEPDHQERNLKSPSLCLPPLAHTCTA